MHRDPGAGAWSAKPQVTGSAPSSGAVHAYNLTFFKEGLATFGEFLFAARNAEAAAGGPGTPAGELAFEQSLIDQFNSTYASTGGFWTHAPSDPTPYGLFS